MCTNTVSLGKRSRYSLPRYLVEPSHYFGGGVVQSGAAVKDGLLKINAQERDSAGKPLEWMEVQIS